MPPSWAESWQRSWDELEEHLVHERERRLLVLVDIVEAMTGTGPMVVDLACGPGTITRRLLDRLHLARSIAVDIDRYSSRSQQRRSLMTAACGSCGPT